MLARTAPAGSILLRQPKTDTFIPVNPIEDYQDVLQNIEAAVVQIWRRNSAMTNYTAMSAYDAAINYYRALANQQTPKPPTISGLDAEVFEAVKAVCELRSGRTPGPEAADLTPIPLEDLVACLRKLRKSVDFWTKQGGRKGYLEYIERFLP